MAQDSVIRWGSTLPPFSGPGSELPATGYAIEAMADGTNFGNPEALIEVVKSLLSDGSLAVLEGWDNREAPIRLRLSAPSGGAAGPQLAAAEKALMAGVLAPSKEPLVHVPPAAESATCVFDVVAARLERDTSDGWDLEEVMREYRYYLLTLTCLPFARSETSSVVAAIPVPPATETKATIDTCDLLTNWSLTSASFGTVTRTNLVTDPAANNEALPGWTSTGTVSNISTRVAFLNPDPGTTQDIVSLSPSMAVTAGTTYTMSTLLDYARPLGTYNPPPPSAVRISIRWYNSAGAFLSESAVTTATAPFAAARFSRTAAAPSSATKARMIVYADDVVNNVGSAADGIVYADDFLFEAAGSAGAYFDGSTADGGGVIYQWSGVANASTSTAATPPSAAVVSGSVQVSTSSIPTNDARVLTLVRSASVAMSTSPYLRVAAKATITGGTATLAWAIGTGTASPVDPIAAVPSTISGYTDYYFETGDFDRFEAGVSAAGGTNVPTVTFAVAQIERTDTIVSTSTTRQRSRTASVAGSAPTQAAIRLFDATPAALGTEILVHTSRNIDWSPDLRRWLVSGGATSDTAMVSGARNTLGTAMEFEFPASLLTQGTYALMARLSVVTAGGDLTWSARIVSAAGATTVGSSITVSGTVTLAVTSGYQVVNLGALPLPPVAVEADQKIELTLTGTANMSIDEAWLFGLDDGVLTWVTDTDSLSWIEIRSPELGAARPSVYGGTGAKGANAVCIDWKCKSFGTHRFDPGLMQVYTIASTSLVAQSELESYPRYHSHVGEDAA